MADANGLNPGQSGYDPNSETDPSGQRATNPYVANPDPSGYDQNQNASAPNPSGSGARVKAPESYGAQPVTSPSAAPAALPDGSQNAAINAAYQKYLGRDAGANEYQYWTGNNNFEQGIANSPEAQAYAAKSGGGAGNVSSQQLATMDPASQKAWLAQALQANGFGGDDVDHWYSAYIGGSNGGWSNPKNLDYWIKRIQAGPAGGQPGGDYYDPAAAGASGTGGNATPASTPLDSATNAAILQLLAEGSSPTNASDPTIAGPTNAFRQQAQYGADRNREALAERAAQEGVGSGAFDTAVQSGNEKAAMDTASYSGQLTQQAMQLKLQKLQTALQFASGKDAQALQLQIAEIQDQLSRAQLGQQNQQFYDNMGYNIGKDNATFDYLYNNLTGAGA